MADRTGATDRTGVTRRLGGVGLRLSAAVGASLLMMGVITACSSGDDGASDAPPADGGTITRTQDPAFYDLDGTYMNVLVQAETLCLASGGTVNHRVTDFSDEEMSQMVPSLVTMMMNEGIDSYNDQSAGFSADNPGPTGYPTKLEAAPSGGDSDICGYRNAIPTVVDE